jgi:hypothetical protein
MAKAKDPIADLLDQKNEQDEIERGATKWEPEEGDRLNGIVVKTGWFDGGDYEPSMFMIVKNLDADGHLKVWLKTALKGQMDDMTPAMGQQIAIRYDGMVQGKTRAYHGYTSVLVPDSDGKVKRDQKYWATKGFYRGPERAETSETDDDGDYF